MAKKKLPPIRDLAQLFDASEMSGFDPNEIAMVVGERDADFQRMRAAADNFAEDYVSAPQANELRKVLLEQARRKAEALALYEPLPMAEKFHRSRARVRLCRGSNRAGKTQAVCAEGCRALMGCDPHGKYPKENGRIFAVGKDLRQVGKVLWEIMGREGAFRIIRDEFTGLWRAYRPWQEYDRANREKVRQSPPMIPERMVKDVAWENKAEGIPSLVRLKNGWEMSFFSSLGKPPHGVQLDLVILDEEIVDESWYPEMSARLLDRHGRMIWSATPQAGTDQLFSLHERAEKEAGQENPSVEEFLMLLVDNPHITSEAKKGLAEDLSGEDYQVRVEGEFAQMGYKVYPEFSQKMHGIEAFDIPADWCRYMVVDPGHQVCAVLFAAVPPQEDHVYLYDELYLRKCDAETFGMRVADKTTGQNFQAFVIDYHFAIHTEAGIGKTVGQQYSEALERHKVRSAATGSQFLFGNDDIDAGILAVKGWLRPGEGGDPRLRYFAGRMPNFVEEIKKYHFKREGNRVTDRPDNRKACHAMDCLRYLSLYNPRYVKPRPKGERLSGAILAFRAKSKRNREQNGPSQVRLGPGAGRN